MMNANRIVAELTAGSERVKMVDMHPKLPILIASLYTGVVNLWNYETQVLVKSFDIGNKSAVRCARFIPRLQSFICGSDDMHLRVYNYNSMERSKVFLAHDDFIRSIAVHERLTAVLSASDDMTIRQWDWSNNWSLQMVYNGHFSFCMAVMINPRDPSTFASASSDMTVRVWTINNPEANFQLEHEEAVTCLEYYPHGDKPYLLTGTEDHRVQLWDYQTKSCLQTFTHHSEIISSVLFFPGMPLIVTAAQDNELKVISSDTFRLLHSIDHASLGRAWTLTTQPGFNVIAAGFDHGIVVYRVGNDRPVFSMDASGRVVVANGSDLARIDIKGVEASIPDGEVLNLNVKDLGSVEMVPRRIIHNPNGQFMALLGEGEYTTISSLSLRPKTYGKCVAFVWGAESGAYAVLADATTLTIFKSFKEASTCKLQQPAVALYAGPLFAVVYANQGGVAFHNWDGTMIRQIDEVPSNIQWSPSGELMALVADSSMFVLKYNAAEVEEQLVAHGRQMIADGVEAAFDLVEEVDEKVKDAMWAGDCLVFVNDANRLNFYMGGEITNVAALSRNTYLLGYVARENRVFCLTKDNTVTSYQLTMKMIEYMTAIVREDFVAAAEILPTMDATHHDKLSAFLRSRGHLELALGVTAEDDPRFNLAMQLNRLDILQEIAERSPSVMRWKQVGDVALKQGRIDVGLAALTRCDDVAGLLLIYSSINDMRAIAELGVVCEEKGKYNVAFTCYRLTQQHEKVVRLLLRCGKAAEASFYARTHMPDLVEETVVAWKGQLSSLPRVRESIANPSSYPNLFPTIHLQPPTTTPVKEMSVDVAAPHVDPQPQEPVIPTAVRHEPAPLTSDANPDDDDDNEVEEEDEELEAAGVAPAADEEEDEDEDEDEGEGEEVVGPSTP